MSVRDRKVESARLESGEEIFARQFISNAHPRATLEMLPEDAFRPAYRNRVRELKDSISCIGGYFTTDRKSSAPRKYNLYSFPHLDIDRLYAEGAFGNGSGVKKLLFITFPGDREQNWPGPSVILALGLMQYSDVERFAETRTGERSEEYALFKDRCGDEIQAAVEEAVPEMAGYLQRVEVSTPLTNRDFTGSPKGAVYGVRHSVDQWGKYALHSKTRIENLLLTGQSILMPGIVGVTIGAFVTCSYLLGFDYLFGKVARA